MRAILRDYQSAAVDAVRHSFSRGKKAPLLVLPTGAGKTVCFARIMESAHAKGKRCYLLVHREELLRQSGDQLAELDVPFGVIAPGCLDPEKLVQIASVQTLSRRMGKYSAPDLIVVDECHHSNSNTWLKILEHWPNAKRLGVTATPRRLDGKGLGGVYDDLIIGPDTAALVARGFLTPSIVYAPKVAPDLSGVAVRGGDYAKDQLALSIDRPTITGDAVAHYRKLANGAPAIAFCISVEHARNTAKAFQKAGFRAECLDGGTSSNARKEAIDKLGRGQSHVLTSCEIISEGTDIPRVTVAIMLRPTKSESLFLQQTGRVLRPIYQEGMPLDTDEQRCAAIAASVKPHAIILDHAGNTLRHGFIDDERGWCLTAGGAKSRSAIPSVKQCPQCYSYHRPRPTCPHCHHVHPVVTRKVRSVKEELVRLDAVPAPKADYTTEEKNYLVSKARNWADLVTLAIVFGYEVTWVVAQLKKRKLPTPAMNKIYAVHKGLLVKGR